MLLYLELCVCLYVLLCLDRLELKAFFPSATSVALGGMTNQNTMSFKDLTRRHGVKVESKINVEQRKWASLSRSSVHVKHVTRKETLKLI